MHGISHVGRVTRAVTWISLADGLSNTSGLGITHRHTIGFMPANGEHGYQICTHTHTHICLYAWNIVQYFPGLMNDPSFEQHNANVWYLDGDLQNY